MTCSFEDNYPLTYKMMRKLHIWNTPKVNDSSAILQMFGCGKKRDPTLTERQLYLDTKLQEIKQPIWSLVEDILVGSYELRDGATEDNFIIEVANQDFHVVKIYHMHVDTFISPEVTNNKEEHELLRSALAGVLRYELHGKYRDQLSLNFKSRYKGISI